MTKIPTPIVDKNGKQTTVHRNPPKLPDPAKLPSRPPQVQEENVLVDELDKLDTPVNKGRGLSMEITKNPPELTSQGRTGFIVSVPGYGVMNDGMMFEVSEVSEYDDQVVQSYLQENNLDELPENAFVYTAYTNDIDFGYEVDDPTAVFFKRVSTDINEVAKSFAVEGTEKEFVDAVTALNSDPDFSDFRIDPLGSYTYGLTVQSQGRMWHVMSADEMKQNIPDVLRHKQTYRFSSEDLAKVSGVPARVFDTLKELDGAGRSDSINALVTRGITANEFIERIYPEDSDKPVWIDEGNEQREYTAADGTTIYIRMSSGETY